MENDLRVAAGPRIKEFREAAGLSQNDLVKLLNERPGWSLHQPGMAKIERGYRMLRLDEALDIATILGVGLEDLVDHATESELGELKRRKRKALAKIADLRAQIADYQASIPDLESQLEYQEKVVAHVEDRIGRLTD